MIDRKDFSYLENEEFLLKKRGISNQIISLLSNTERALKDVVEKSDFQFPENTFLKSGKISKGENYKGLPFFVLDYPRLYSSENIFAFRSMIWWGNEISFSLLLSGESINHFKTKLESFYKEKGYYLCVNDTPWEYHFHTSNFQPVSSFSKTQFQNEIRKRKFFKVALKYSLDQINDIPNLAVTSFKSIIYHLS